VKIVFGLGGHQVKTFSRENLITGDDRPQGEDRAWVPTAPHQTGRPPAVFFKIPSSKTAPGRGRITTSRRRSVAELTFCDIFTVYDKNQK
jgi:hypothetical protein